MLIHAYKKHWFSGACCTAPITPGCRLPRQCYKYIMSNCPDRKIAVFSRKVGNDRRSAPRKPLVSFILY